MAHGRGRKKLDAFIIRYAALFRASGQRIDSYRRKPHKKQLAEFVFATDAMACDVMPGFDDELLGNIGDELALQMNTPRSDLNAVTSSSGRTTCLVRRYPAHLCRAGRMPRRW